MNILAQMTTDLLPTMVTIEGFADSALGVAVGIGGLVIGWYYIRRLVKTGIQDREDQADLDEYEQDEMDRWDANERWEMEDYD